MLDAFFKSKHRLKKSYSDHFFEVTLLPIKSASGESVYHYLPERINLEKVEKAAANLHDKTEYVIHTRNLKQALNRGLLLKKVYRVIKCNQNAWLKP